MQVESRQAGDHCLMCHLGVTAGFRFHASVVAQVAPDSKVGLRGPRAGRKRRVAGIRPRPMARKENENGHRLGARLLPSWEKSRKKALAQKPLVRWADVPLLAWANCPRQARVVATIICMP